MVGINNIPENMKCFYFKRSSYSPRYVTQVLHILSYISSILLHKYNNFENNVVFQMEKKKIIQSSFALQLLLLTCEICHWNQTTHWIEKSIYNNSNFYTIDYVGTSWKSYVIKFFDSIVRNHCLLCSSRSILTWQANNFFES